MSIIKSHDMTLPGGDGVKIVLKPLCDGHLPLLYKWNAEPEVLYRCEEDDVQGYAANGADHIYGSIHKTKDGMKAEEQMHLSLTKQQFIQNFADRRFSKRWTYKMLLMYLTIIILCVLKKPSSTATAAAFPMLFLQTSTSTF